MGVIMTVLSLCTEPECGFQVANTAAALGAAVAIAVAPEIAAVTYVVGESVRNSTNKANEKEVKQQFVAHMTKKQQLIVDSTCTNYSKQVEQ
jgi:hypothetical protein